jgi:hypothetical protein
VAPSPSARKAILGRVSQADVEPIREAFERCWVCELHDGVLVRMHFHSSHAEALEAVGLGQ